MMLSFLLHSQLHVGPSNRLALHQQVLLRIEAADDSGAREAVLQLLENVVPTCRSGLRATTNLPHRASS